MFFGQYTPGATGLDMGNESILSPIEDDNHSNVMLMLIEVKF